MKAWSEWEIIRRQVAIGGRIIDKNEQPLAGMQVTIKSMPKRFKKAVDAAAGAAKARWEDMEQRLDRVTSRSDGIYYFLDLPEGKYALIAADLDTGKQQEKQVSLTWDKKKKIVMAYTDFKLSVD